MEHATHEDIVNVLDGGRVKEIHKVFCEHEDGMLAFKIQSQEYEDHYVKNRFNRRTVREDIPVARVADVEQQKERMRKLAALQAQAEADEIVARQIHQQVQVHARQVEAARDLEDEDLARQLQDKEKAKYQRHLQKKHELRLRQERKKLEMVLAQTTEEARLTMPKGGGAVGEAIQDVECLQSQALISANSTRCQYRVRPSGHIEDDGDFSDFFSALPDDLDPGERKMVLQQQDAELASLLQEQEHKRTKAEVNREKLMEIRMRDEQLASVLQEEERLRERRHLQRVQQKQHHHRWRAEQSQEYSGGESLPLGASANMMSHMRVGGERSEDADGPSGCCYRRNSYTRSIEGRPSCSNLAPVRVENTVRSSEAIRISPLGSTSPDTSLGQRRSCVQSDVKTLPDSHHCVLSSNTGVPATIHSYQDHVRGHSVENQFGSSEGSNFNIAAAIDPTYHRRNPHFAHHPPSGCQVAQSLPMSTPLQHADDKRCDHFSGAAVPVESIGGNTPYAGLQDAALCPVQGQRRSTLDSRTRVPKESSVKECKRGVSCRMQ